MEALTVLLGDEESESALPASLLHRLNPVRSLAKACDARRLFVVTSATALPDVSRCVSEAARRHRLQGVFIRNDLGREWINQIFERAALRRIRNALVHSDTRVLHRLLKAASIGAERSLIADATVAGDRLFVMDCAFRLYEMPFDAYPALRRIPPGERDDFEIVLDGAFVHWPRHDVDLDLESVLVAVDPERRRIADVERLAEDEAFGAAVRALRERAGLLQAQVEGLSERQVRRIEKGEVTATVDAIEKLAASHHADVGAYLESLAEHMGRPVARP